MKRVSLGVILPGIPDRIQEKRSWLKIYEKICKFSMIPCGIFTAFYIFNAVKHGDDYGFLRGLGLILMTTYFFVIPLLWNNKRRCAYCHHFFMLKRISDDNYVGSTEREVSQKVYDYHSGVAFDFSGNSAFYNGTSSHREYGKEVTDRYSYNIRCSYCGAVTKVDRHTTDKYF